MPKREIFVTELFTLSGPIWIGDLRTDQKIHLCEVLVDIPHFVLLPMTECAVKIIPRLLSNEYAVKIILFVLSME